MIDAGQLARPRRLSEVISDSFNVFLEHPAKFAAVVAPAVLVGIAVSLVLFAVEDEPLLRIAVTLLSLPIDYLAYQLVSAGLVALLKELANGRLVSAGDALDLAQDRARDVIGASLRSTVIIFLLAITILGLPWAIKRGIQWAFIIQAIMIDGQTSDTALSYSATLVQDRWWNTFLRLVACGLIVGIPMGIVAELVLQAFSGPAGAILSAATNFVLFPYVMIASTLIFWNLKATQTVET